MKKIIGMYFGTKSYLKSIRNHNASNDLILLGQKKNKCLCRRSDYPEGSKEHGNNQNHGQGREVIQNGF
jgi:hypothetical protein